MNYETDVHTGLSFGNAHEKQNEAELVQNRNAIAPPGAEKKPFWDNAIHTITGLKISCISRHHQDKLTLAFLFFDKLTLA